MADEKQTKAKKIYATMVSALEDEKWRFDVKEDELKIVSGATGEDLSMRFTVTVDAKREVIQFLSPLPFNMAEDKRIDAAIAVCVANYGIVNGSFDYDMRDGEIRYRLTTSYVDCEVGKGFFMNMMLTALNTTDRYNDRFLMLSKGTITLEKFIELDNK